jgi:hypothetical protein
MRNSSAKVFPCRLLAGAPRGDARLEHADADAFAHRDHTALYAVPSRLIELLLQSPYQSDLAAQGRLYGYPQALRGLLTVLVREGQKLRGHPPGHIEDH